MRRRDKHTSVVLAGIEFMRGILGWKRKTYEKR